PADAGPITRVRNTPVTPLALGLSPHLIGARTELECRIKGDRRRRRIHSQQRIDSEMQRWVKLLRRLQAHPDGLESRLKLAQGFLNRQADAPRISRTHQTVAREIWKTVR